MRQRVTVDLAALRRNVRRLRAAAGAAELWAVVKSDAYGHGALDIAPVALAEGAGGLCVATAGEGAALRAVLPSARILVMGPLAHGDELLAREAGLEVAVSGLPLPEGLRLHLKVDTGMGRWGMPPEQALAVEAQRVAGVMSHFATADDEPGFARRQLQAFLQVRAAFPEAVAHIANSAATLRLPEARLDAVRCGIALYGVSPFGDDPAADGLEPVLAWHSTVALVRELGPGASTGYGRAFVAPERMRIGLVPIGYADGLARASSGSDVLVDGLRAPIVGRVSMDAFAVALPRGSGEGSMVTLIGDGLLAEERARGLGTIAYEVVCNVRADPARSERLVVDG